MNIKIIFHMLCAILMVCYGGVVDANDSVASKFVSYQTYHLGDDQPRISAFIVEDEDVELGATARTVFLSLVNDTGSREGQLITHQLFGRSGDGNSLAITLGQYKIQGDQLILYSYWATWGDAPAYPYGAAKILYQWDSMTKRYHLKGGAIYLEENGYEIAQLTHNNPLLTKALTDDADKRFLVEYMARIESLNPNLTFVTGPAAEALFKEVNQVLSKEVEQYTGDWDDWLKKGYPGSGMGFRR